MHLQKDKCHYKSVHLKLTPNDVREFYYGKCIDKTNENYFIYNLICVLLHFCYATEDYYISYEYFLDTMNEPDEYPYSDELKGKIIEAFGSTDEIQGALSLTPYELFHFLYNRFNSYHEKLPLFNRKQQSINAPISSLQSISLQSNILQELALLIQKS